MVGIYEHLGRLTPEQALKWLNQLCGADLSFEELIELCNSGHCRVYIDCSGERILSTAEGIDLILCDDDAQVTKRVYSEVLATGQLTVYGATVTTSARGKCSGQENHTYHDELEVKLGGNRHPLFKPAEIQSLATKLKGKTSGELHPNERRSVGQIMLALATMAGLDLSTPYAADETLRAFAATAGLELPDSPETLAKHFRAASSTKKN